MPTITADELRSRGRIARLEAAFVDAVDRVRGDELTHEEVLIALNNTSARHLKHLYLDTELEEEPRNA